MSNKGIGRFYLSGMHGDLVSMPVMLNKWSTPPDTSPVVPATLFHEKLIGEEHMAKMKFLEEAQKLSHRNTTTEEDKVLQQWGYLAPTSHHVVVVESKLLKAMLEKELPSHMATIICLEEVGSWGGVARQVKQMFPESLPECKLSQEQLQEPYSLSVTQPGQAAEGSTWDKQLDHMYTWRRDPPMSAHAKAVSESSWQIMEQSLDEFAGWASNYKHLQPNMDLLWQPPLVAAFLAFKKARGNTDSTLLRTAQQLSWVLPCLEAGNCPQAKAATPSHANKVKDWFKAATAKFRQSVADTTIRQPRQADVTLAEQWEVAEDDWQYVREEYEVRKGGLGACVGMQVCTQSNQAWNPPLAGTWHEQAACCHG